MAEYDQMVLVSADTGKLVRPCSADDWATYLALLEALTPAAKEYGVVDGKLFGVAGQVFTQAVGAPARTRVSLGLSPHAARRLKAFGAALGMTPSKVVEFLLEQQPLPQELNAVPERLTKVAPELKKTR